MSSTMEMILVGVVVLAAGIWAGRSIWKSVRGKGTCSGCASSTDCPLVNQPDSLVQLGKIEQCGVGSFECPSRQEKSDHSEHHL